MLAAGTLDRRITLQQATEGKDAAGGVTLTWADLATVWARVAPAGGREVNTAAQEASFADTKFTVRYRPDVTPGGKMRILFDARVYDILSVSEPVRRESVEILAQARTDS